SVTGLVTGFSNIQNLTGGSGNDSFVLAGGSVTNIDGGAGSNTLTGDNNGDAFTLNGSNSGNVTSGAATLVGGFSDIENLSGGGGNDSFVFKSGGFLGGNLIGGGGGDALDYSGYTGPISVNLASVGGGVGSGTGTAIGGTFSGISILKGSSSVADQLTGPNQVNTWQITSANGGTVDGFGFNSIENLTGGNSTNQFVLNGGNLSGSITGGAGPASGNSLQGNNVANTWTITAANQGTVTGVGGTFLNIGTLIGGTGADDFIFNNSATLGGTLNGGGGNDTLDWSAYTTARNVTLTGLGSLDGVQGTEASIAGGFDNITAMAGANSTGGLLNSLTGPNSTNTWNVTASNAGTLNGALSFSNFQTLTGGGSADTFNLGAGMSGSINGGGGFDTANIVNSFTAPAPTLTINNVGTIVDNADATITATTLAISGASSIGSASHPLLANLTTLQIGTSNGNAFISTGSIDLQGINLGSGSLTLVSSGAITDTTGQNVIADTLDLTAVTGIGTGSAPIETVINTLNSAVSGTGSINVNNSGAIVLGAISTKNGAINSNSSGTLTVDGPIASGGNGAITLITSGGDLTTAGNITADGSGDVNLSATGNLNLDSSVSSGNGTLLLTGGTGVTGNASSVLNGGAVNVSATSGNISFASVSSGAPGGTILTAPGSISLQGFTTTLGALTVRNGGTFLVSGPVNLGGALDQTGAGPVVLDSSISSRGGNVQFASPVTVDSGAAASIATGGDIIFNQNITGSGNTSSLALNSGAGNINLQAASNLGTLNLQTSGTLSLGGNLTANNLLTAGVTGNAFITGANVSINTTDSNVDFSHATGINGLNAGGQSLAINSGTGNVTLSAVGQNTSLKNLTVNGGTITLANVTTGGSQSYTGSTQLGGNLSSLSGGSVTLNGNLALLADASMSAAGGGNIGISGAVNGTHALTLTTPSGAVVLGGVVGGSSPLTSLSVNSATASLDSVTTSGTQSYQSGSTRLAGVLNSKSGAINFGGVLDIASASTIQANGIGFNGGASSVRGNTTLTLLPETNGLAVNIGGSGSGLTLNNTAMDGYNGGLYIGTGPGPGGQLVISVPVAAGNVTVNGSLTLGSSGSLLLAGMGNLYLNSGTLTATTVTLIAGSQDSVTQNPGASQTLINANTVILVSGSQIGNLGQEVNIQTTGSTPQVQVATGAIQTFLLPPNLPVVIGPAATIADDIAAQLGLFIQANSQVTSIGQQIAALVQTGGLLSGFIDVSLFQNISLYDVNGQGIALPVDQCEQPNNQLCSQ
ncbi:MAG: beta strand repeat-containing protein, partial [Gammaproteobacteria bacterium]